MSFKPSTKPLATNLQKENFKNSFADIVKENPELHEKTKVQFFDTTRTNYVINGVDGKSMNVIASMSEDELEQYRVLKNNWLNLK